MVIISRLHRYWSCHWFYTGLLLLFPDIIWFWQNQFAVFKWVDSQLTQQLNSRVLVAAVLIFYPIILAVILLKNFSAKLSWPDPLKQQLMGVSRYAEN